MALRYGNREQTSLLPSSIEDYVSEFDPVRVYDTFVEALDFIELGIDESEDNVGNASYDPRSMLKLLLYGYSYGIRSSRKLEQACYHNLSFIWLTGGLKPDHKTIANFRRNNADSLKRVMRQCVRLCIKLDLIEGNILFVDGTKIKGNVSKRGVLDRFSMEKSLKEVDRRIEDLLLEAEELDTLESDKSSLVRMREDLCSNQKLREEISSTLREFSGSEKKFISLADKDALMVKSHTGYLMGYNGQVVTDEKNGLIVNSDIIDSAVDEKQLSKQIEQANENLDKKCDIAVADAGYDNFEAMSHLSEKGIEILVPESQETRKKKRPFGREKFKYDKKRDCYYCPEGHVLQLVKKDDKRKQKGYRIVKRKLCRQCKNWQICTKALQGRTLKRSYYQETIGSIRRNFRRKESQEIFAKRKYRVEHPFAYIKSILGYKDFIMRSRKLVNGEFSLMTLVYNIKRMCNLVGVKELVDNIVVV